MSSIVQNEERVARFTSSQIYKLVPLGKRDMTKAELEVYKKQNPGSRARTTTDMALFQEGGLTYIRHKRQEFKRKRSMSLDAFSRATAWGEFMEKVVYDLIGLEYKITSKSTKVHPKIKYWSGSQDLIVPKVKISEIKCYQPEKFCDYADCLLQRDIALFRDEFPEEYWQIVSNAIINRVPKGEALLYQPYDSEADMIYEKVVNYDGEDAQRFQFIANDIREGRMRSLPFQPNDSEYPNLISFEFEVPKDDRKFLTERVKNAVKLLISQDDAEPESEK